MKNKESLVETMVESTQVFNGGFMNVFSDKILLPNEKTAVREYIKHPGASCIIAITDNNEVILEYQYRYPVKKTLLELPAGKLDENESALECAKRELEEETGYTAKNWVELGTCLPCIAYSTEKIVYFLATGLTKGTQHLDDGEFLEIFTMPLEELLNLAYNGEIQDSKTISALMLYIGYTRRL
jgi:ADP-ribose pyrophosphatase